MNRYNDWFRTAHIRALVSEAGGSGATAKSKGHLVLELISNFTGLHCEFVINNSTTSTGSLDTTTNKWSGLLSYLINGTVDATLTLVSATDERVKAFDFVSTISYTQYELLISKQQLVPGNCKLSVSLLRLARQLNEMFNPFAANVWLVLMIVILLLGSFCTVYAFFPMVFLPLHTRKTGRWQKFSVAKIGHELFNDLLSPMFSPQTTTMKTLPASIHALCAEQRIPFTNSPVTIMFFAWSLCCFLLTTIFIAHAEMHSAIDAPPAPPFNSIASFAEANYYLLLERHSSNEQRIRTLVRNLRGTPDGVIMERIVERSEPYWHGNYTILAACMRGEMYPDKKFAFLTSTRGRDMVQDERCDLHAAEFPFQPSASLAVANVSTTMHDEPLSMALQKHSPFLQPLSHMVQLMQKFGLLEAMRRQELHSRMENGHWLNGEKYKCVERIRKKAIWRRDWVKLRMCQVLPIFEFLVLCLMVAAGMFFTEILWARKSVWIQKAKIRPKKQIAP